VPNRSDAGRRAQRRLGAAAAALVLLSLAMPGVAAEKKPLTERLLDIMREKNVIDDQQYEELLEQAREEAETRPVAAVSAPADTKPDWDYGWKNGFYLKKSDGSVSLKFGGRIDNDWAVINQSENLSRQIGEGGTGTLFRRARLSFEGTVYDYGIFKAEYDFADGETALKDVWVGLQDIPWIERIRIGHMKEPFSLEQMMSSKSITFVERPLSDALVPARNTGLMIDRNFLGERIYFGVGGFANTNDSGTAFQNDSNYNVTARLTGVPIYSDDGGQILHLGLNYSHGFGGDGTLQYRTRPETRFGPTIENTGTITGVTGRNLVGGELAAVFGPVYFQSEIIASLVTRERGLSNPRFWGAYGEIGWFLTGETRQYDKRDAIFVRPAPNHSFSVKNGTWGAWELALRYSYLSLAGGGIDGGIVDDVTGGLNWHLFPNLRLMFNYVFSNRHGLGYSSIAESRVQFNF
jgi:phosphate-selective porin OprO/OprP